MKEHLDPGIMEDLLEGLLSHGAEDEAREHLASCSHCRRGLADLERFRQDLGGLPVSAEPPRDLWPQIAWRIEGGRLQEDPGAGSGRIPTVPEGDQLARGRGQTPGRSGRWVTLPAWQLLAASIALMVISGGTVWAVLSSRGAPPAPAFVAGEGPAQLVAWEEAYAGYDEAVSDLESVLERGRELLDPETIRVLEENLRSIDQAIQEASEALRRDPASPMLQRFLADNMRKKVDLLRQAAGAVYSTT